MASKPNIDFSLAHKLGGMALRAAFFEAYRCPFCTWPVYIHYTFGSKQVPTVFLPLCSCPEPTGIHLEMPAEENIPLEREAIATVIAALRQLLRHHAELLTEGETPNDRSQTEAPEADLPDAG